MLCIYSMWCTHGVCDGMGGFYVVGGKCVVGGELWCICSVWYVVLLASLSLLPHHHPTRLSEGSLSCSTSPRPPRRRSVLPVLPSTAQLCVISRCLSSPTEGGCISCHGGRGGVQGHEEHDHGGVAGFEGGQFDLRSPGSG